MAGGQNPASSGRTGGIRGGGRGQGTSGQPAAPAGNPSSTGRQGVQGPKSTGAGQGRIVTKKAR
jgi:hypothetical protein